MTYQTGMLPPEQIANDISDLTKLCSGYGVNETFVLSLICRKNNYLNKNVTRINILLNLICKEKVLFLQIIEILILDDLWEDGLHLTEQGKAKLAQNFIDFLKSYY